VVTCIEKFECHPIIKVTAVELNIGTPYS